MRVLSVMGFCLALGLAEPAPAGEFTSDSLSQVIAAQHIRYERAMLDQTDPYFNEQTFGASYYRSALGVRFDINAKSVRQVRSRPHPQHG